MERCKAKHGRRVRAETMIISHEHRYLFIELHHTASTAISRELRTNYGGVPILCKHAAYSDFLRVANPDEKGYFTFSCVRHPMDSVVSLYCKYRDGGWRHGKREKWQRGLGTLYYELLVRPRYQFVHERRSNFASFFLRYYHLPYDDWSSLAHKELDYVIRFEDLQDDFRRVLRLLGIELGRPLPFANRTPGKDRDFLSYYTVETWRRARWVFGPHMEEWGYSFPAEWDEKSIPALSSILYQSLKTARRVYWRHWRLPLKGRTPGASSPDERDAACQ